MLRNIFENQATHPLHLGGRLFQQHVVEQYAELESNNLRFLRLNQKQLQEDLYFNITDALSNDDERIGKRVILPSSFPGWDRYMAQQQYND
jgi:hypothetical protein